MQIISNSDNHNTLNVRYTQKRPFRNGTASLKCKMADLTGCLSVPALFLSTQTML